MITKIIFTLFYSEGSASANRIIALSQECAKQGLEVILILGSNFDFKTPKVINVRTIKCVKSKILLYKEMSKIIRQNYSTNAVIYSYGTSIPCLYLSTKYNIFCEYTEVPFYGRKKTILSSIKEWTKQKLTKKANGIFVISNSLYQYYSNIGIKNIEILNMFVDSTRFNDNNKISKADKYIAYCGKISEFKDGVDCLIKAFDIFHESNANYKLKIIGNFESKKSEENIKLLVSKIKSQNNIEFTGKISPSEMPSLLTNASILALARPNNEQAKYGFPTKLGEYLATGNPIVLTNVGEISNFLKDGINCIFARPDDPNDFAEKLIWVANNYEKAHNIGNKGKILVSTEFSAEIQAKKAIEFINKILN